jgi:hypothetical protein
MAEIAIDVRERDRLSRKRDSLGCLPGAISHRVDSLVRADAAQVHPASS